MTRRTRQAVLATIASFFALVFVLFLANRGVIEDAKPPRDLKGMAAWLTRHPGDWNTANRLSDAALKSREPRRIALWRASFALANHIAPRIPNPRIVFVRGGLAHWKELTPADRRAVIANAAPLLHDPELFRVLRQPLFALTHDFDYVMRNAPRTLEALDTLRHVAASNGLFARYRELRGAVERQRRADLEQKTARGAQQELPALLPRPITKADEPLLTAILKHLQANSFDPERFADPTQAMIEYAIEHRVEPLDALEPFVEVKVIPAATRARLALALDKPEPAATIELTSATPGSAEWMPYYLERARYEASRGNAGASDLYLRRAAFNGFTPEVLATAEQCARVLRNDDAAMQFGRELAHLAARPRVWSGTCGQAEVCTTARTVVYSTGTLRIDAATVQSDRIPPYVEIYADDALVAEGEIVKERTFSIPLARGIHRVEVRLVNPRMVNGVQRRVRLS